MRKLHKYAEDAYIYGTYGVGTERGSLKTLTIGTRRQGGRRSPFRNRRLITVILKNIDCYVIFRRVDPEGAEEQLGLPERGVHAFQFSQESLAFEITSNCRGHIEGFRAPKT